MNVQKLAYIENSIVGNFKTLCSKAEANTEPVKKNFLPVWGLEYRENKKSEGYVNAFGHIVYGKNEIAIDNNGITLVDKPFYRTVSGALNKINKMLSKMIRNFENKNIVVQSQIDMFVASPEWVAKIEEANRKLLQNSKVR